MSGKLLTEWRHDLCAEITKKRYISDQEALRIAHAEIVNLFFPQETSDESDEINSETSDKSRKFLTLFFPAKGTRREQKCVYNFRPEFVLCIFLMNEETRRAPLIKGFSFRNFFFF